MGSLRLEGQPSNEHSRTTEALLYLELDYAFLQLLSSSYLDALAQLALFSLSILHLEMA